MKKLSVLIFSVLMAVSIESNCQDKENIVLISTDYGDIKIKLYNKTEEHRDNFLKLAEEGFYNGTLFHRVISEFMIQGGDPDSKNTEPGKPLGNGGPGYTLPAEIIPEYFHKRGALAAARQGDNVNPEKRSSGSQFYIVQGRKFIEADLENMEKRMRQSKKHKLTREFLQREENKPYRDRLQELKKNSDQEGIKELMAEIEPMIDAEIRQQGQKLFSEEQIKAYTTVGGAPHLDGEYTVFGEVIEGMDVLDKIAAVETVNGSQPAESIKMTVSVIK